MTLPVTLPTDNFPIFMNMTNSVSSSVGDMATLVPSTGIVQPDLISELNTQTYNSIALIIALGTQ